MNTSYDAHLAAATAAHYAAIDRAETEAEAAFEAWFEALTLETQTVLNLMDEAGARIEDCFNVLRTQGRV